MKTKEYVNKYRLNENDKFNHSDFVYDLTHDFVTLLETTRDSERKINSKGFWNTVRAIRMKWDAINNKTLGQLSDKLWNYFYATVVCKMKVKLFPEEVKINGKEE